MGQGLLPDKGRGADWGRGREVLGSGLGQKPESGQKLGLGQGLGYGRVCTGFKA